MGKFIKKTIIEYLKESNKQQEKTLYHSANSVFNPSDISLPAHFGTLDAAIDRAKTMSSKMIIKIDVFVKNSLRLTDDDIGYWDFSSLENQLLESGISQEDIYFYSEKYAWDDRDGERGVVELLKSYGYDSIVYKNLYEDKNSESYIIFDKYQIKNITTLDLL